MTLTNLAWAVAWLRLNSIRRDKLKRTIPGGLGEIGGKRGFHEFFLVKCIEKMMLRAGFTVIGEKDWTELLRFAQIA